uniref:Uncharacterized protein n=1 Tax=Physcomitrium patens TaxID=3218 RepID=A0A2K1ITY3_PHYPA|nr:hypothetical protein PHYPA_024674 [Physcomitrium patens]
MLHCLHEIQICVGVTQHSFPNYVPKFVPRFVQALPILSKLLSTGG